MAQKVKPVEHWNKVGPGTYNISQNKPVSVHQSFGYR